MHTYVPLWFLHWHTVCFWWSWQLEGEEEEEKDEKGGRRGRGGGGEKFTSATTTTTMQVRNFRKSGKPVRCVSN